MPAEPTWDYWCPHEGTHVVDPAELWVGVVTVADDGTSEALYVAAIVPPMPMRSYVDQNEAFARTIRDALAAGPWHEKDGFQAAIAAHGSALRLPKPMPEVAP